MAGFAEGRVASEPCDPASSGADAGAARVVDQVGARTIGAHLIGGKARGLLALEDAGLSVPPWICVTTMVFDEMFAAMPPELRTALDHPPEEHAQLTYIGETAQRHFRECGLYAHNDRTLSEWVAARFPADARLAVRSSAVGEDAAVNSFAGQFSTFLCVEPQDVPSRVVECFASAFTAGALSYRRARQLESGAACMSVVIQLMIDSRAAGVVFSVDPTGRQRNCAILTAGLGLGEGIVNGQVAVDTYAVDADGRICERKIASKRVHVVERTGISGRTMLCDVDEESIDAPALSDETVLRIVDLVRRIAVVRGAEQDLEWAVDRSGALWALQARPVTTAPSGWHTVFDNANIVESYPGLTSPMTFSLMRRAYEVNFRGLVRAFGASQELLDANRDVYPNLVGLLDGHMYYNLSNWYRMFLQAPGFERALPAFEEAMGFKAPDVERSRLSVVDRLRWLPRQMLIALRLLSAWLTVPRGVRRLQATAQEIMDVVQRSNLQAMEAHDLVSHLEGHSERFFDDLTVAPISDFFTQQLYGLIGRMIAAWQLGPPITLRNELLCGEDGMMSVEPVRSLVAIAERAKADDHARSVLEAPDSLVEKWTRIMECEPGLDWLRSALTAHLQMYGDRTMNELKLETATLRDEPAAIVGMLCNFVRGGQTVASMVEHEQRIRREAEQCVRDGLRRRPLRRLLLAVTLRRTRRGLRTRENIRFTRARMSGVFRTISQALGDRLTEQHVFDRREDVFYLSVSEVADVVRGAALTQDLRALVGQRRREYELAGQRALPPRIDTWGIVHCQNVDSVASSDKAIVADNGLRCLRGTGCSPGRVTAPARVLTTPAPGTQIDGEILVADATDPGWVFLMVAAGGLVSEHGNVLSHTAIVGRELGIPTIVGVEGVVQLVPDGAMVALDGAAGTLTVLGETPGPEGSR